MRCACWATFRLPCRYRPPFHLLTTNIKVSSPVSCFKRPAITASIQTPKKVNNISPPPALSANKDLEWAPSKTILLKMNQHLSPVEKTRIHLLNQQKYDHNGKYVLYWMQNSVRTRHNPALEHASYLSQLLRKPLRVIYILSEKAQDGSPLPQRHASFLFDSLFDVSKALKKRNIPFAVAAPPTDHVSAVLDLAHTAAAVVTDHSYLRPGIVIRNATANRSRIPFIAVEADVVVPVAVVSSKAEHAARTIRPKITRLIPEYLKPLEQIKLEYQQHCDTSEWLKLAQIRAIDVSPASKENLLSSLDLDFEAPVVTAFRGGEDMAQKVLSDFIKERLAGYSCGRNEPANQLQSDLSPYLRAGNISPVDIVLRTKTATKGKKQLRDNESSFLEELIVRRELAVNACWFNPQYDDYKSIVPRFARESLAIHKKDKRPTIFTYDELEAAVTGDIYWNAAQLEMIVRGKMHGYMRMYWAKQIIGWVEDPAEAMDYALRLNNRWELDAVDPNSYVGVIWCFGLHDQGWRERPIWGKVRYMNEAGLRRKFNMAAYVAMIDRIVAREGLPVHIAKFREQYKPSRRQVTIEESLMGSSNKSKVAHKRICDSPKRNLNSVKKRKA